MLHLKGSKYFCVADPDPGSGAFLISGSGMGKKIRIRNHISESLKTIFWFKILKFFDADPEQGSFRPRIRDLGWKNSDPESGINMPDTQH
jgi:hypothetical protein